MRLDREDIVASLAINLCTLLFSLDMLDPEECTTICQLVFFDNKLIARAAGKRPTVLYTSVCVLITCMSMYMYSQLP